MLGHLFIPYHTNRYNRRKVRRFSRSFTDSTNIGILCTYKSLVNGQGQIEEYMEQLKASGKKVSILIFHENSADTGSVSTNSFSKRDINFFGIWTNERIKSFVKKEFDFLFNLDTEYNTFIDNILAQSKAGCRVGIYNDIAGQSLELMIKPEEKTITGLIQSMKTMLERIQNDE